jgi:ribosomal protein S18 acetylase RimI-like enzyme
VDFAIRQAELADADALGAVHIACWREAYQHLLSADSFRVATPEWRAKRWQRILAGGAIVWLAETERDGDAERELVGFASAGDARGDNPPRGLELHSIYALAKTHGTGLGQALLDAAIGTEPASLWVAEINPRAQAFYRRNGFDFDGTRMLAPFVLDTVAEVRMLR